jgi:hypothetical protein
MLREFEELPESSRVWVYQSDRAMDANELDYIKTHTEEFISSWESHGTPVPGSFKILYDRFLIIAADETGFSVSGCSKDKSVHFLQEMQNKLGIDFFDRLLLPFKSKEGISFYKMSSIRDLINKGEIQNDQIFLNTLVSDIRELNSSFEIKAGDSFLARYWSVK